MKTVLQGLREMEASLLNNQPELEALEQIELLRASLSDKPEANAILAKLQDECAPGAEKARTELTMIREAIQILEDQQVLPEAKLDSGIPEESFANHETDQLSARRPTYLSSSDLDWKSSKFSPNQKLSLESDGLEDSHQNGEIDRLTAEQLA